MEAGTTRRRMLKSAATGVAVGAAWHTPANAAALNTSRISDSTVVNVRGFGAAGDGATDDTAAIVAAVAAAFDPVSNERNVVYFPAGTYVVSQQIEVDYGIVIEGAGLAASIIKMNPSILSDMFVGAGGFPVAIEFRNLTLDGGFSWANSKSTAPAASGSVTVTGSYLPGVFYEQLQVGPTTVGIGRGDVLRLAGQPATFSTDALIKRADATVRLAVPMWAPAGPIAASTKWSAFSSGDLISNIGRLIVDNCCLIGAKRHCISLPASGEIRITRSKIGMAQGCGVFSDSAGDGAIANCWFIDTGGANIYSYNAYDFRFAHCLIEGGAVANVYSDWGQVKIASCDLWGGRAGNIVAHHSGWVRGMDLQIRDPGSGGTAATMGSTGYVRPTARPAIDCEFSRVETGAVLTAVALASASDAVGSYSPHSIVKISNGSRSNLAQIEYADGITFVNRPIDDAGLGTATRSCRGHVRAPSSVRTAPGADAVIVNHSGTTAVLVIRTATARIISVKVGSGLGAIKVFDGGSSGTESWQCQYTTPPIPPNGAVTVSTEPSEAGLNTTWFSM